MTTLLFQDLYTNYYVAPHESRHVAESIRGELRTQVHELADSWSLDVWKPHDNALTLTWKKLPPRPTYQSFQLNGKLVLLPPDVLADIAAAYEALEEYARTADTIPPMTFGDSISAASGNRVGDHADAILRSRGTALSKAMWAMNSIESHYDLAPFDGFNRFVALSPARPDQPVITPDTSFGGRFSEELYRSSQDTLIRYVLREPSLPIPVTVVGFWPARCNSVGVARQAPQLFVCNGVLHNLNPSK